ncbi:XRE family transcriptional regulator [Marinilabiliaceae bacterium JC040]|nr:XRE family transcriptional regulator [Marinilabiliaceae bacterium JC040]
MKIKNKEKLLEIISDRKSNWLEYAKFQQENANWLEKSAKIAIVILRHLRKNNISQIELAKRLNVSAQYVNKILKGRENLSLETISKLESALNIDLIEIEINRNMSEAKKDKIVCININKINNRISNNQWNLFNSDNYIFKGEA